MTAFQSRGWLLAGLLIGVSAVLALGDGSAPLPVVPVGLIYLAAAVFLAAGVLRRSGGVWLWALLILLVVATVALTAIAHSPGVAGVAEWGFWLKAVGLWLADWMMVDTIANSVTRKKTSPWHDLAPPVLFGLTLLILWEWIVLGFGIPAINLLAPSTIGVAVGHYADTLSKDFIWTFLHEALLGWLLGSGAGFLMALVADRIPFLRRGLLPLGNIVSALPIVGIAPIMIWWFTYDWPSKTAVVIAMTFFPMLVNTVAGLAASGSLEKDLMRSYGASYWSTLTRLRLPAAMPFIFNGLKINSTLAMIGAIVAEYLDGPTIGMGFRINTQAALSQTDIVWAEIAVAMVAGSIFYGIIALVERAVTFWHPSYRRA
jgi:NitT/TauT family transport system permease protein